MKNIFFLAVIGIIGYYVWNTYYGPNRQLSPSAPMPYIHVHGIDQDPNTASLRNNLETNNIEYVYKLVIIEKHRREMLAILENLGRETNTNMDMPVVDVNGYLLERPEYEKIMELYKKY